MRAVGQLEAVAPPPVLGRPSVISGSFASGRRSGTRSSWSTKCGKWNDTQPATPACAAGHEAVHRRPALEQVDVRRAAAGFAFSRAISASSTVANVSSSSPGATSSGNESAASLRTRSRSAAGSSAGQLVLGVLLARAPDDEVLHPEDRRLARRRVELRLARRLDAEQPRHERAQRARHLDQQRRLLGRRQRRAVAVRREARRQRRVARGQRRAELRVQRRQPLGLVEIAVPEAVDTEREVSRLVARRASGAVREGKLRRRQRLSS